MCSGGVLVYAFPYGGAEFDLEGALCAAAALGREVKTLRR